MKKCFTLFRDSDDSVYGYIHCCDNHGEPKEIKEAIRKIAEDENIQVYYMDGYYEQEA